MLESGMRMRNYLMTPTDEQLKSIGATGDVELSVVEGEVTAALADNITPEERRNPKNYTPVLNVPFYPFENPYANGGTWNIPGSDGKEHVLKIDYAFLPIDGIYNMGPREATYCATKIKAQKGNIAIHNDPKSNQDMQYYETGLNEFTPPNKRVMKHGETIEL